MRSLNLSRVRGVLFGLVLAALVGASMGPSIAVAQQEVASRLQLNYNPESAIMNIIVRFDQRVSGCRLKIRAGISYEGEEAFTRVRRVVSRRIGATKKLSFRLEDIVGAENNEDGNPPILSMQATALCDGRNVSSTSSPFARYVSCGVGQQDVTVNRFLRSLEFALRDAEQR